MQNITHMDSKQKKLTKIIVSIIIVLVAFFIGMKYGEGKVSAKSNISGTGGMGARNFAPRTGGTRGGDFTAGQVIGKDDKSITVSLGGGDQAGSTSSGSTIIFFGGTTQVMKSTQGTINDVAIGSQVVVTGTKNADGSVTAQSIQIRPAGMNVSPRASITQ